MAVGIILPDLGIGGDVLSIGIPGLQEQGGGM